MLDFVPVDYVSNMILVATAYTAQQPAGTINILHSTTSSTNPLYFPKIFEHILAEAKVKPSSKQMFEPHVTPIANENLYEALLYM